MIEPLLWSAKEVAIGLGVSVRTIQYWAAASRLPPCVMLNGHPRWRVADIRAWVEAGCPEPCRTMQIDAIPETDVGDAADLP